MCIEHSIFLLLWSSGNRILRHHFRRRDTFRFRSSAFPRIKSYYCFFTSLLYELLRNENKVSGFGGPCVRAFYILFYGISVILLYPTERGSERTRDRGKTVCKLYSAPLHRSIYKYINIL